MDVPDTDARCDERPRRGRMGRMLWACRYTTAGLLHALRTEHAFQEEAIVLVLVVLPGAFLLGHTRVERLLMIACWLLVMIVELLNTSIETVIDRIGSEHHELSGHAKDLGSAAVGISIALAGLTWALILLP